jgi:hypothetical protein
MQVSAGPQAPRGKAADGIQKETWHSGDGTFSATFFEHYHDGGESSDPPEH